MSHRDDRFIIAGVQDAPLAFAYEHDGVTLLIGQQDTVWASYRDGDTLRHMEIADARILHAFRSMIRAAIINGIREQTGKPEDVARILAELAEDDRRRSTDGLWTLEERRIATVAAEEARLVHEEAIRQRRAAKAEQRRAERAARRAVTGSPVKSARNALVEAAYKRGVRVDEIASVFGITVPRVYQILQALRAGKK